MTIINGHLRWITPSVFKDNVLDHLFVYELTSDRFNQYEISNDIKYIKVIITESDMNNKDLKLPKIISSNLTDLELYFDFKYSKSKDYLSLKLKFKDFVIPENIKSLTISNNYKYDDGIHNLLLPHSDKFPSSIKKLVIPWLTKDQISFIPPSIKHLVLVNQVKPFSTLPTTIDHIEFVDKFSKVQKEDKYDEQDKNDQDNDEEEEENDDDEDDDDEEEEDDDDGEDEDEEDDDQDEYLHIKSIKNAKFPQNVKVTFDFLIDMKTPQKNFHYHIENPDEGVEDLFKSYLDVQTIPFTSCLKDKIYFHFSGYRRRKSLPNNIKYIVWTNDYFSDIDTIPRGFIKPSVKSIRFWSNIYDPVNWLPNTIEHLIIDSGWESFCNVQTLPESLKYLNIGNSDLGFDNIVVPEGLRHLEIYTGDWITLYNMIPKQITHLKINVIDGSKKRDHININLPSSLVHVDIDPKYIDNIKIIDEKEYYNPITTKSTLKKLHVSNSFNQMIPPNSLPPTLEDLSIGKSFNKKISKGVIPESITRLTDNTFNGLKIKDLFPNVTYYNGATLKRIELENAKEIEINSSVKELIKSKSLKSLTIIPHQIYFSLETLSTLYPNLEKLKILTTYHKIGPLPNIKEFSFKCSSTQIKFPDSIQILKASAYKTFTLEELPKSLKELRLGYKTNKSILSLNENQFNIDIYKNNNNKKIKTVESTSVAQTKPINNNNSNNNNQFLQIWRNIFLKKKIIDSLLNPSGQLIQDFCERDKSVQYISYTNVEIKPDTKKIYLKKDLLHKLYGSLPNHMTRLLSDKYHCYEKGTEIPIDTDILIWTLDEIIPQGIIPFGVRSIYFSSGFNQIILPDTFPDSVMEIAFGFCFNQNLKFVRFPKNLISLYFGEKFNQLLLPELLPETLKYIGFEDAPNNKVKESLPLLGPNVDHLLLHSVRYANNLNKFISPHIKYIKVGRKKEEKYIQVPPTVKCVTSYYTNIKVADVSLETTKTSSKSKKTIENNEISGSKLDQSIALDILIVEDIFIPPHHFDLLKVKSIAFDSYFDQNIFPGCIPNGVESVKFGENFNKPISANSFIKYSNGHSLEIFPSTIKYLKFGKAFNQPIVKGSLPSSVSVVSFGEKFVQVLEKDSLPTSITKLTFESGFYHPDLLEWIPSSVTELQIGKIDENREKEKTWNNIFPIEKLGNTSITKLILGDKEIIESPKLIPSNIKEIRLCKCNTIEHIPNTIEALILGNEHNYPLNQYF
ncbi:hypothetical protein CYY_008217 [Polysphondylium violaceum]|uniref:FNIP repeat-containing protein n=1 Tax=Polysphondylium violaceum TaxID=133409 RepID=A0A8J4PM03_9MYCE|nr:hypothetical protein CYY_008217 [Polysphondylium violaceum]